jgi:hypothetical protein
MNPLKGPFSFQFLAEYAVALKSGQDVPRLLRTKEVQAAYDVHKSQIKNMHDYIHERYLFGGRFFNLVLNKFPLNLEPGIMHYVLWVNKGVVMNPEWHARQEFPFNDIVIFENKEEFKSVPSVKHYHVFVKTFSRL